MPTIASNLYLIACEYDKSGVNTFDSVALKYKLHQLTRQNICSKLRNSLDNKTMHMQKHSHVLLSEKNVRIYFEFVLEGNIHKNMFLRFSVQIKVFLSLSDTITKEFLYPLSIWAHLFRAWWASQLFCQRIGLVFKYMYK